MTNKAHLLLFLACFIGHTISPSYASDAISYDSFEGCADGSTREAAGAFDWRAGSLLEDQ